MPKVLGELPSKKLVLQVKTLVKDKGQKGAVAKLGIARETLVRLLKGDERLHRGTIAQVQASLAP